MEMARLNDMTVPQLRAMANEHGLVVATRASKPELIDALMAHEDAALAQPAAKPVGQTSETSEASGDSGANVALRAFAEVTLTVPLMDPEPDAHQSAHVEVGALTRVQRLGLKRLWTALHERAIKVPASGGAERYVQSNADAIRYLLERIGRIGME